MTEQNTQQETTTPETTTPEATIHPMTRKAADTSLAKRQISPDSHKAVLVGDLSLEEARTLGREGSPYAPAKKTLSKNDRSRECACGCGQTTRGGTWIPGHDARLPGLVLRAYIGEIELTAEQREHAERRNLFAKAKVAAQRAKEEARAEKKAQKQREREDAAEAKKAKAADSDKS